MICPYCGGGHGKKKGVQNNQQRFVCYTCKKQFQAPLDASSKSFPRILLFDIETSLMKVYVWGLYKQFIPHNNIIDTWFVISWSAKWLYDKKLMSDTVTPKEAVKKDDRRILKSIHALLNKADIVIGHNVDRFDIRKLNWRFISNNMKPPLPYRSIDTLKVARSQFAAPSYKQDYLTKYFALEKKLKTGFKLWIDCMGGDKKALKKMARYNRHDVIGLEEVYLKLRPYIKNHPNLGILMDEDVCTNCGSHNIQETEAVYFTSASKFPVFRCSDCKTPYIRGKKNVNQEKTQLRPVSR